MIIKSISDIREITEELIELREGPYRNHVTKPNIMWKKCLEMMSFIYDLSDESLQKIRLHTGFGFFIGSNWSTCYYEKQEIELGIKKLSESRYIEDYNKLTRNISEEYLCSEIDINRSLISIKYNDLFINEDVLRVQSTISNLSCLSDCNINKYLEVGGGYGGLCNQFRKLFKPRQSIIIDHPEVNFWSAVYTFINNPGCSIEIVNDNSKISNSDFVFIPTYFTNVLENEKIDLLVNENSFSEMTSDQVNYYLDTIPFELLYTNNRDKQFMNNELNSLNSLIVKKLKTAPDLSFYEKIYNKSDMHNQKYHMFASKNIELLPDFDHNNICGLTIRTEF